MTARACGSGLGDPTGVFIEREMRPDRRVDLVSPSSRLHARRPRPHHADVGSRLSCLRRACRDTAGGTIAFEVEDLDRPYERPVGS